MECLYNWELDYNNDNDYIELANTLFQLVGESYRVSNIDEIEPFVFFFLYEKIVGLPIPGIINDPDCTLDLTHNVQMLLGTLGTLIGEHLRHIDARDIVARERIPIGNLLEIFQGLVMWLKGCVERQRTLSFTNYDTVGEDGSPTHRDGMSPEIQRSVSAVRMHARSSDASADSEMGSYLQMSLQADTGKQAVLILPAKVCHESSVSLTNVSTEITPTPENLHSADQGPNTTALPDIITGGNSFVTVTTDGSFSFHPAAFFVDSRRIIEEAERIGQLAISLADQAVSILVSRQCQGMQRVPDQVGTLWPRWSPVPSPDKSITASTPNALMGRGVDNQLLLSDDTSDPHDETGAANQEKADSVKCGSSNASTPNALMSRGVDNQLLLSDDTSDPHDETGAANREKADCVKCGSSNVFQKKPTTDTNEHGLSHPTAVSSRSPGEVASVPGELRPVAPVPNSLYDGRSVSNASISQSNRARQAHGRALNMSSRMSTSSGDVSDDCSTTSSGVFPSDSSIDSSGSMISARRTPASERHQFVDDVSAPTGVYWQRDHTVSSSNDRVSGMKVQDRVSPMRQLQATADQASSFCHHTPIQFYRDRCSELLHEQRRLRAQFNANGGFSPGHQSVAQVSHWLDQLERQISLYRLVDDISGARAAARLQSRHLIRTLVQTNRDLARMAVIGRPLLY